MVFERTSAANEQPRHVTIALLERVRDFIATNEIPLTSRQRLAGYYVDPDKTADTSPFTLEGLITVAFEDGALSFTLPP